MKRSMRALFAVSLFTLLLMAFSALTCTAIPVEITFTVDNTYGADIIVRVFSNGELQSETGSGIAYCTVNAGSVITIYDVTHHDWLDIKDGGRWVDSYPVTQATIFRVKYNLVYSWYVEVVY